MRADAKESEKLKYVGGVDISFVGNSEDDACAALVVFEYPSMKVWARLQRVEIHFMRCCAGGVREIRHGASDAALHQRFPRFPRGE